MNKLVPFYSARVTTDPKHCFVWYNGSKKLHRLWEGYSMTSQAIDMTKQISAMSEPEIDFIWDYLRKRRNDSLLKTIDIKLEEAIDSRTLSDEEANVRLKKLGIT